MEYRITHRPAPPCNDLNFIGAGQLTICRQGVELEGTWRPITPQRHLILSVIYSMLLGIGFIFYAMVEPRWVGFLLMGVAYLFFMPVAIMYLFPRPRTVRLSVVEARRNGREINILYPDVRTNQQRHGLFHAATEDDAEVIFQALRTPDDETHTFAITHGPESVRQDVALPGRITIDANTLRLNGRIPRDPQTAMRRLLFPTTAIIVIVTVSIVIVKLHARMQHPDATAVFEGAWLTWPVMGAVALGMLVITAIANKLVRSATLRKTDIDEVVQSGRDVSFLAPLDDGANAAPLRVIFHARTSEDAAAIAHALTSSTTGDFPIVYGPEQDSSELGMFAFGRLNISPKCATVIGRHFIDQSRPLVFYSFLVAYLVIFVGVFAWMSNVVHSNTAALGLTMFFNIVISVLVFLLPKRADFPRATITAVARRGRQIAFLAPNASGTIQRAVIYARTEPDAEAIERELSMAS